jgi:hypothetical protein
MVIDQLHISAMPSSNRKTIRRFPETDTDQNPASFPFGG